ncbi:DNA polymerase I [Piscinibacter koreensis]|uniref:DNA polymerase I n=1 Tax=Piscinibacter koreensis TaxID=2742824 RepID=A0A7Y6NLL4_9BURK|nr:DNA polymerase I [Schlegelella koreensis]NUZ05412.1 DNA polymerase I [Schlegelella koreensis]
MTDKTLLLVDGSSYLYRAYHALPDLRGVGGKPIGAIHGVVSMMKKLRDDNPALHGACVFDAQGSTFRNELYPDYKANRSAMPPDLAEQIEPIVEAVKLLGWPVLSVPGIEADDAIGTISCMAAKGGFEVVISTGDKDLAQLVGDRVTLINTMSNERLDIAAVTQKFGVPPERIVDYLALVGDSVDNIPGVDKVGPKTAAKWIAEHGSLDGVIAAAPTMKGMAGENLRKALDWLPQGRRLATVVTDCDLSAHVLGWPEFESLKLGEIDRDALIAFYDRYGLKSLRRELETGVPRGTRGRGVAAGAELPPPDPVPVPSEAMATRYETIVTMDALDGWIAKIAEAPLVALDVETGTLDPIRATLIGLSFSVAPGEAAYVPLRHDYAGAPDQLPVADVLERLRPWLEDADKAKVGQNTKFDSHVFAGAGVAVRGYVHDTMLESYVIEAHRPHTLESLAFRHVGRTALAYEDVAGKGVNQIPFAQVDVERAARYSCEDSEMALHVHQALWPRLASHPELRDVYERIEMPTSRVLGRIEAVGVLIDSALLASQSQELAARMSALEQQAFEIAGQPFNLGSPKQIGEILFGKLGMPVKRRTASGAPSTDEDVLQELAADYPLPAKLLEHRSLSKLKGTYTDKLPLMVNPATGRVHTTYAQAVAVTGRLSSNDPNLQNIPIRTPEGRRVREAFIAPPGCLILSADYSQIELRIMAHISADDGLLRAFGEGIDIHRATAAEVFGMALADVTHEQRRYAKVINFGLIYGMSAFGLAQNLGIERSAATAYIERYFSRFAGVKRYMDETRASALTRGYVETLFGRRVHLPEIAKPGPRRSAAERQAINAPMQGTAADLIKLAMIAVQDLLDREQRATRMIMQVHDELVFEVPDAELEWARNAIPATMASVAELRVPLVAEVGVGPNWDQAH